MTQQKYSIRKTLKSFTYAFNGLRILLTEEPNARIHLLAAIGVIIAGFLFRISVCEWIAVIFAIGLVFALETFNTALEHIADFVSPDQHNRIKKIKDLSATAVLLAALTALVIGLIIFLPKIIYCLL